MVVPVKVTHGQCQRSDITDVNVTYGLCYSFGAGMDQVTSNVFLDKHKYI